MNESKYLKLMMDSDPDSKIIILQGNLKDLEPFFLNMIKGLESDIIKIQNNMILEQDNIDTYDWEIPNNNYLMTTFDTRPTLRLGDTGHYVIELQEILTKLLYYPGTIDGNYGANTENAVKRFQVNNRLTADGVVGRDTWSALSSLYSPLAICEEEPVEDYFLYTIVRGDTLWVLARKYGTTIDAIKSLNNLTSDRLSIGQILKIPNTNMPNYTLYTVVRGDTIFMGNNE